jgi:hypothetical protein
MCGGGGGGAPEVIPEPPPPQPVFGTIGGRQVNLGVPGQEHPGILDLARGLMQERIDMPQQQVAGFTPDQLRAFQMARQGVGAFQPFLGAATGLTQAGVGALEEARLGTVGLGQQIPGQVIPGQQALGQAAGLGLGAAGAGIAGLAPGAAMAYMNPFEQAVVQQTMADIARQGEIAGQGLRAGAVSQGAFGGSRQAVAEQELQRNILEQQARSAAQLRAGGFEQAAQRAQQAAQTTGQLGMAGAQLAGNLGLQSSQLGLSGIQAGLGAQQQAAGLGQGIAGLGQQFAGLGQAQQQMNLQDLNTMLSTGQQQQRMSQAQLDAAYANQMQTAMQPFQQLAFYSDIVTGAPSGQMQTTSQPGPSIGSQMLGLGMAAVPAVKALGQP